MTPRPLLHLGIVLLAVGCSTDAAVPSANPDLVITSRIRQTLLEPNSFSLSAKNVTIVTEEGQVTLSGLVESEVERREVAKIARQFASGAQVRDDLEISPD